jgi:hypothetical protein
LPLVLPSSADTPMMETTGFPSTPPGRASSTLQGIRLGVLRCMPIVPAAMVTKMPKMAMVDQNLTQARGR